MYIYQNGKLYIQKDNRLIGVEIYSDKVLTVEGTETELSENHERFTPFEVYCKFQIRNTPYIFPRDTVKVDKKVVEKDNDTVGEVKATAKRRSTK